MKATHAPNRLILHPASPDMSLKAELETWASALKAYDEGDFEKALDLFSVRIGLSQRPSVVVHLMLEHASASPTPPRYSRIRALSTLH